jgi:isocitrate dehydrogenase
MTFTPEGGGEAQVFEVYNFKGDGVAMSMYNTDESIYGFARSCFNMALEQKMAACTFLQKIPSSKNMMAVQRYF